MCRHGGSGHVRDTLCGNDKENREFKDCNLGYPAVIQLIRDGENSVKIVKF